ETVGVVEEPLPENHGYDSGNQVGEEHHTTQQITPAERLVKQQRRGHPEYELERHGHRGVDDAVVDARPELRICREVAVVPEPDEGLHWHERVLVEEAQPEVVEDRVEDQSRDQEQRRGQEEPPGEGVLPHWLRSGARSTTSA